MALRFVASAIAGIALALLPARTVLAQTPPADAADARELEATSELLRFLADDAAARRPTESVLDYSLQLATFGVAKRGEPETLLRPDPESGLWRVEDLFRPRPAHSYVAAAFSAELAYHPTAWLSFATLLDTREVRAGRTLEPPVSGVRIDGAKPYNFMRDATLVRSLVAELTLGNWVARAGRYRLGVARGLVLDDFVSGVGVLGEWDRAGLPLSLALDLVLVHHAWKDLEAADPLLHLGAVWQPSEALSLRPFAALYSEHDGGVSSVMRSTLVERVAASAISDRATQRLLDAVYDTGSGRARLVYAGSEFEWSDGAALELHARLSGMAGRFTLGNLNRRLDLQLRGAAADIQLDYALNQRWTLAALALLMSGSRPVTTGTYSGFIAPAPYWTWTGLFFGGGLTQGFYPDGAAAAGVNGHGVFAAGPSLAFASGSVYSELSAVWLQALAPPPAVPLGGPSSTYGVELDWRLRWDPCDFAWFGTEVDLLLPGGYFYQAETAYRALLVGALTYDN